MKSRCRVYHCPRPDGTCLKEQLRSLIGQCVTVVVPGGVIQGPVRRIGREAFVVAGQVIPYLMPFYLILLDINGKWMPYHAEASIQELGTISGRLSRIGKDYAVLRPAIGRLSGCYVLIPIHIGTQLTCEPDHEE